MAKRKDNYAWVKVNTKTLTATFDGPLFACVQELFLMLPMESFEQALESLTAAAAARKQRHAEWLAEQAAAEAARVGQATAEVPA